MDMLQCMFKQTRLLQHEYIKLTPAKFFSKMGQIKKKIMRLIAQQKYVIFKISTK